KQIAIALSHFSNRQVMKILVQTAGVLDAILVDLLLEIAMPIKEPDRDEVQVEIARRFAMIARQNAEAAGVIRDRFVKAELGRKISDRLFDHAPGADLPVGIFPGEIITVGVVNLLQLTEEILVLRNLDEARLARA